MSEQGPREPDQHLILDEVTDQLATTFRLLTGDPDQAAERAFADIGVNTRAEAALLGEIAAPGPLAHPDRFEQSHRLAMRALEVVDRAAWKHPRLPRLGPLSGAAESAVELVARTIVQGHVADVVRALSRLYARREAQSQPNSPEPADAGARPHTDRPAGARLPGRRLPAADGADRRRRGAGAGVGLTSVRRAPERQHGLGGGRRGGAGGAVRGAGLGAAAGRRARPPAHPHRAQPVAGGALPDDRPLRAPARGRQLHHRRGSAGADRDRLVRGADRDAVLATLF
jgi:hypothetical protein